MGRLAVAGLLLSSCWTFSVGSVVVRSAQVLDCSQPTGVPLSQIEPFRVCGELLEIVEGESATLDHYPLAVHRGHTTACFEVNVSRVYFAIDWCSRLVMPVLMLNRYIQHVNFSVDRDPGMYMFFGCSDTYRTKFQIMPNGTTSRQADCLTVLSYARDRRATPPVLKQPRSSLMATENRPNIFHSPEKLRNGQENLGPKRLPSRLIPMLLAMVCMVIDYN